MRLAIDLDGVVADFVGAVEDWVRENYGYDPVPPTSWDWFMAWPDGKMLWRSLWEKGVRQDGLFLACAPIDGAIETLHRLDSQGHEIVFVTHRPENMHGDTRAWLDYHDLTFPVEYPDHQHHKLSVDADVWLDDKVDTVERIVGAEREGYLFEQPWNQHAWDALPTVDTWETFEWFVCAPNFEPDGDWIRSGQD